MIYNIISMVLVNHFKHVFDVCIDESQSAFVLGQFIFDNILTAYEVLHSFKRRQLGRTCSFALKLDISKAYDWVEWHFLEAIMLRIGFCFDWVSLIMLCVLFHYS